MFTMDETDCEASSFSCERFVQQYLKIQTGKCASVSLDFRHGNAVTERKRCFCYLSFHTVISHGVSL